MSALDLLEELGKNNIKISIVKNRLDITAPRGYLTNSLKNKLKYYKEDIIQILLLESKKIYQSIKPINRKDIMKLSFPQRRLWFINQFEKKYSYAYNIVSALKLKGTIDIKALQISFNKLIERHESLRTVIAVCEEEAGQSIVKELKLSIPIVEVTDAWVPSYIEKESKHVFDLTKGPLVRVSLLRLLPREHILLVNMHHLISDGWSLGIFYKELSELYKSHINSETLKLQSLPVQYVDFAHWQRETSHHDLLLKEISYWKVQLSGSPTLLRLPTDWPRPAEQSYRGSSIRFTLPAELVIAIRKFSRGVNATPFMTLLAAFNALLAKYSGDSDICIGTPVAGRRSSELESIIGLFVNTLVIRTKFHDRLAVKELVENVRDTCLSAYENQAVPFEYLLEALGVNRSLSYSPVFQVMFSLQNTPEPTLELPNVSVLPVVSEKYTSKFDLIMDLAEVGGEIQGILKYKSGLFRKSTVDRMVRSFRLLLDKMISEPYRFVDEISVLDKKDEQEILLDWNSTKFIRPKELCIHELFLLQVEKTPSSIAVTYDERRLTYNELNIRSNQLANHLIKNGVGPEVRVGLCIERSLDMIIGILGIIKAGAAYVPIDTEYPSQRIESLIEDSGIYILLVQKSLQKLPANLKAVSHLYIDESWPTIARESCAPPKVSVHPENLLYVIYTSGSTGRPKGVMVTHAGLSAHIAWKKRVFGLNAEDTILQKTPIGFDVSVWEWSVPLVTGANLQLAAPGGHRDPAYLLDLIESKRITVVQAVPSLLGELLREADEKKIRSLRYLFCGGEPLSPGLCSKFKDLNSQTLMYNFYGPSEATIDSTYWLFDTSQQSEVVPIGRPVDNGQIYILDKSLNPVPIGVVGEIYIGGDILGRGYDNRQDITALNFIPNRYSEIAGDRLYRSGDLGRYLLNGDVEYIGRIDYQVKIRGFRIELGEIESALFEIPEVDKAVVVAHCRDQVSQSYYLAAYIVLKSKSSCDQSKLRDELKRLLPEYMIPSFFILLQALPLTENGKLDRKALPEPDISELPDQSYAAPRTETELALVDIWSDVLRIKTENLGVNTNFFDLGGDSILSLQIIARARNKGIQLTPRQMFENQTISELAKVAVKSSDEIIADQGLVSGEVELTPIQRRFFENTKLDFNHFNQSILFIISEKISKEILVTLIESLVLHHDALRLRFLKEGSGWVQFFKEYKPEKLLEVFDLSDLPMVEKIDQMESKCSATQKELNIEKGPLLRAVLFTMGEGNPDRLLIAVHHLAIDGVSWRILLEDIKTAYMQISSGSSIKLPTKTTSYKAWSEKLQSYSQSEQLLKEWHYWNDISKCELTSFPQDFTIQDSEKTVGSEVIHRASLKFEETQKLLQEVPTAYSTQINEVLLTGLMIAFYKWSGQNKLLIDLEGHGREDIFNDVDVSRTVGWFTSVFPVVLELSSSSHIGSSLKAVKEKLRRIPERGIGYGLLRYCCRDPEVARVMELMPEAKVVFNYLGQFDQLVSRDELFQWAPESVTGLQSKNHSRRYSLVINCSVKNGCLHLPIAYSCIEYRTETIAALSSYFLEALRALIQHCTDSNSYGYTPTDFPDVEISAKELDEIVKDLEVN
ncbi:amino acid adenylation domain-containing protein [Exilibacterium tricleocarpae]|uniref:Amino acid adenylation domain-containing protein n=1 Tax=Exilibacterium tricleocarpae TaxID=2591008 RepID=A0A545SST2_9GAMM|nr:non-ribosomal peptide synthetase [Exilibacterium tricleocarpae]TQV68006.1 amino acid adenylation domain-containing protein [Exilibacterium tricleocarpae]